MANGQDVNRLLFSYLTLRKTVGVLGITFPMVLAIGCLVCGDSTELKESISAYYATNMRDIFVGILFAIGCFFFAYRGYDDGRDIWPGKIACVSVLGVALFPVDSTIPTIETMHYISAFVLFATLSYFSICLFTSTSTDPTFKITDEKRKRNKVYKICGYIMCGCIASIIIFMCFLSETKLASCKPVFWLETFLLVAFGVSWLIKGETLLKDSSD